MRGRIILGKEILDTGPQKLDSYSSFPPFVYFYLKRIEEYHTSYFRRCLAWFM
jgi:hypothetical protein